MSGGPRYVAPGAAELAPPPAFLRAPRVLVALALAATVEACAGATTTAPPPTPRASAPAEASASEPAEQSVEGSAEVSLVAPAAPSSAAPASARPSAAPPPLTGALFAVREQLEREPPAPLDADAAAWLPLTLLRLVHAHARELPAPAAPQRRDDAVLWPLVALSGALDEAAARRALCAAVLRAEPRARCAEDTTPVGATLRPRVVLGWRVEPGAPRPTPNLATPLRALARGASETCLLTAERTPRSVELAVRARDPDALALTLALLTVAPGLGSLLVVRTEREARGLFAQLSWPVDEPRIERAEPSLGDDPWPARCDDRSTLGAGLPPGTLPAARRRIEGARARGAVLSVLDRSYFVTEGDVLAGYAVRAIDPRAAVLERVGPAPARPRGPRAAPLRLAFPAAPASAPAAPSPLGPVRVALPPEPPSAPR